MPFANLNRVISEIPLLSFHAVNGEDVSAELAGLVDRLRRSAACAAPEEYRSIMTMIRGRLLAQLESLEACQAHFSLHGNDAAWTAERDFYLRAIGALDAALEVETPALQPV